MRAPPLSRALTTLALAAIALWVGGMLTLGAIVAPVIFGMVPSPTSADAMTVVFRRFDKFAIACVVLILLSEVGQAIVRKPLLKIDVARVLIAVTGAVLVMWQAVAVSPKIEALHRAGAIRGLGDLGLELERAHNLAELGGKAQAITALILIALHVWSLPGDRDARAARTHREASHGEAP